ncbi:rhomboid family intramembrane serine protease [Luteimonas sp. A478]
MFSNLPPVTRALLGINVVVFLLQALIGNQLFYSFMLWPLGGSEAGGMPFLPWQLVSYGFLHAGLFHLLFNMVVLFMFGAPLEHTWGPRRFLTYFLVCVVGAGLCQLVVVSWSLAQGGPPYPTLGASGGVFGVLLAFGMLFPNQRVMLMIPPIPMKARTLVIALGVIELVAGISGTRSGVAHFAHLGGMLFGWLLIQQWRGRPPFSRRPGGGGNVRRF